MRFLAVSGSTRQASTNTAMLRGLRRAAEGRHDITIYDRIGELPIFSPDLESPIPPKQVGTFVSAIAKADGLIIASPEYVRSIPGGLKNAIDCVKTLGNAALRTEVSYLNGEVVRRGTAGSVRLDVVEGDLFSPIAIYDLKTGSAKLTQARISEIQRHLPAWSNAQIMEIRP